MDLKQILGFVGVGLAGLNVLFCVLALALDSWIDEVFLDVGLWKGWTVTADWLHATRAMVFLGLFCMIGALVTAILYVFVKKDDKMFLFITIGLSGIAGLFMMIGFAIFADETSYLPYDYGAGFALCVIGWLLAWGVAGLFAFMFILSRGSSAPS
ncbi:uncharacterized protein LOC128233609 [Mya arenaria]|uniref:uncharacterized protein LOC128233609 n=1 Tax=Mya arenaria TaxID=6604 RepID=UPI0022E8A71A|nr:uncharacterized protein LOC128233609 [Mya arenaria]